MNNVYDALCKIIKPAKETVLLAKKVSDKKKSEMELTFSALRPLVTGKTIPESIKAIETMRQRLIEFVKSDDKKQKLPPSMQKVFGHVLCSLEAMKIGRKSVRDDKVWTLTLDKIGHFGKQGSGDDKVEGFRGLWESWNVSEVDYAREQFDKMLDELSEAKQIAYYQDAIKPIELAKAI